MKKPSAATVIATLALFVALGGTGYAAVALAPNSVGTTQLKEGAVQSSDIKDGAISSSDIANGAIGSDDIKSGSIQVSDLSKGAMKGLDGKDGAQGPAGPAGPAGARGPAGASGSGGGASGGLVLLDGNGNEVTGIQPGIDANFVINGTLNMSPLGLSQAGYVRYFNGALWVMKNDGTYYQAGEVIGQWARFQSEDCTGPMYLKLGSNDFVPTLAQVTRPGSRDSGRSGLRNYYRRAEAVTFDSDATGSWSGYQTFARNYTGDCIPMPAGDYGAFAPRAGEVWQKYESTPADTFPTAPAATTPPFSWSAG